MGTVQAQVQTPDIQFQHISQGLSQNTVTSILQDQYGFLWFGTRNGLNRYDGVAIKQYDRRFSDSISVSHGNVNCIFEDSNGILWVGTREGGLNWYHRESDQFINVQLEHDPHGLNNASVTTIYEDRHGNLWVGTQGQGLILFDRETFETQDFQHQPFDSYSLSGNFVIRIFEDKLGNLWVASRYNGLNQLDEQHQRFYRYFHDPSNGSSLSHNGIRDVLISSDGNIWIATQEGLSLMYRDPTNQVRFQVFKHDIHDENSLSYNVINALGEDDFGNIWVGTENGGLSIYNPRQQVFERYFHNPRDPNSVGSNSFWCIYKDLSGTMWLGPLNSGINKYDPHSLKFKHHQVNPYLENTLSHNNVTCFLEDKKGNLWIGTDGGGLNYFNRSTNSYTHYRHDPQDPKSLGSDAVLCLIYDLKGRLWVGTWEGGLNLFHPETGTFERFIHNPADPSSISSNNIFSMLIDDQDRFWVGASRGALDLLDPNRKTFQHFRERDFPNSSIYKVYQDRRGIIWLGSEENGLTLFEWNGGEDYAFRHFSFEPGSIDGITARGVINIFEDSQDNLWIGTEGGGLNLFDRAQQKFQAYTKADGLPNDVIYGIIEDQQGFIWLSSNKGVSRFNVEDGTFRNYDHADGLQADEFIRGAHYQTNQGELIFGGIQGFNTFFPEEVRDNPQIPRTLLTEFRINNQPIRSTDQNSPLTGHINDVEEIVLAHDQSMIGFEYVAISYAQASKNQYQYILEGYDQDWQIVGNNRRASYSKVPPGEYVFKVKGSNNDLTWDDLGASVRLIVNPPWWATNWAFAIYAMLALGLLLWSRQVIINRERLKSNLRLEHMELTKMQEVDQMKNRFFANISHEFRTPLTLIKEPLKAMYNGEFAGSTKNQYRIMLRNTQKLLRLINQLLDLSKLGVGSLKLEASRGDLGKFLGLVAESFKSQADRQCITFTYQEEGAPFMLYFDAAKLEDIVCNLLSNAFKFTPEYGSISMKLSKAFDKSLSGEWAQISIKDTGIGIPQDQLNSIFDRFYQVDGESPSATKGTGIGLALTKELVDLHHGKIYLTSEVDQGSEFVVLLPVDRDHIGDQDIVATPAPSVSEFGELTGLHQTAVHHNDRQPLLSLPLILVVEDDPDLRAYITEHLETNHRILEASNGQEAFGLAVKHQPELILSDVKMPVMGGVALCRKIKQDERVSHIPVVLLTGKVDVENEIKGLEHGADYYFTKPFNSKLLQLRIYNIIQSRAALKSHFSSNQKLYLEPSQVTLNSRDEVFLKEALSTVEEHISDPDFTVIEFGKELGLSRMKLYRKLKSITGQSANEFIRTIRLKRAAQLIEQNQMTIAEITYEVGFNDLQYFRECFKKHFGVTPSKYLDHLGAKSDK